MRAPIVTVTLDNGQWLAYVGRYRTSGMAWAATRPVAVLAAWDAATEETAWRVTAVLRDWSGVTA
jgi:hypothetical protein